MTRALRALASRAEAWSVESQLAARRNALVANTALSERRRDREDVERWFAQPATPAPSDARAGRR